MNWKGRYVLGRKVGMVQERRYELGRKVMF